MLALGVIVGCDRGGQSAAPAPAMQSQASAKPAPLAAMECEISSIVPLLPRRVTHIAVDPSSNLFDVQESTDGADTLFIIGSDGVSNALPLSARAILIAMDEKGSGNIQSIAVGSDGNVYFYFGGGTMRKTVACLGRFETRTGVIRILARENELAEKSGMGDSLALARGELAPAGRTLWLYLHHTDDAVMFNLRPGEIARQGEILLPTPTTIRSADGTLNLTQAGLKLSAGPGDLALVLDVATTALWSIDLTGRADVLQTLVGLPKQLSSAAANSMGDIALFAAPSEPIEPRVQQRIVPADVDTHYPSLLILRGGQISAIPRDDFHAAPGFPLYSMQLDQLIYDAGRDSFVGYDFASGQLVRLRISARRVR